MKVRVLRPAFDDLAEGRGFYDRQEAGVGDYFFDSLFAEIDSLVLYAGIHPIRFGFHRLLARRFPYAVTIESSQARPWCFGSLIAVAIHGGFGRHSQKRANR